MPSKTVMRNIGFGLLVVLTATMLYYRLVDPGPMLRFFYTTRSSAGQENVTPFFWAIGGAMAGGYGGTLYGWLQARRKVNAKYAGYVIKPPAYILRSERRGGIAMPAMICLITGMILGVSFGWYFG